MAITGKLVSGIIGIGPDGNVTLTAGVDLYHENLGQVGNRAIYPNSEEVKAQVRAFIVASLPALSAFAGFPITLPEAPAEPPPAPAPLPPIEGPEA